MRSIREVADRVWAIAVTLEKRDPHIAQQLKIHSTSLHALAAQVEARNDPDDPAFVEFPQ